MYKRFVIRLGQGVRSCSEGGGKEVDSEWCVYDDSIGRTALNWKRWILDTVNEG